MNIDNCMIGKYAMQDGEQGSGATQDRRSKLSSLTQAAGYQAARVSERPAGLVAELDPAHCEGRRVAVIRSEQGLEVVVEVKVPEGAPALPMDPGSDEALTLLGRLTMLLSPQGISTDLTGSERGIDRVLVRAHTCDEEASRLSEIIKRLRSVAEDLTKALAEPESELASTLAERLAPQLGRIQISEAEGEPVIVPTHDPEQLDRLQGLSEKLKGL